MPSTSNGKLICIIQKTHESKTILGAGLYSLCEYSSVTSMYSITAPKGGLAQSQEYTISIIENTQLTSAFNYPQIPQHYELPLIYNSELGMQFGDIFDLEFAGLMKQFSVNHRILRNSERNFIGFTFKPRFTLPASSLTSPVTESVLEI